jgi:uncharacterized protein YkwD
MQNKILLSLAIVAVLALDLSAQSQYKSNSPYPSARLGGLEAELTRFLQNDEDAPAAVTRPRVVAARSSAHANTVSLERAAFNVLNQKRAESGLSPLAWNEQLAGVARLHSKNMAEFSFFSHKGLDGKMAAERANQMGLRQWRSIGENIAYSRGFQDPVAHAVRLWLDSPAHRQNLLDGNWKETAVGIAVAEDGSYYFTQVFLRK